jgi:hypothetical protein
MRLRALCALAAAAPFVLAASAQAQQEWSFEGNHLLVTNMIGEVTVRGHDGGRIIVRARPGGEDGDLIRYEVKHDGAAEFHAVFPLDRSLDYSYPRRDGGSTSFHVESWREESSFLDELLSMVSGRDRVRVRDGGGGLEAWVDLEVLVPRGVASRIKVAVGHIEASDVQADVDLDTHSGSVRANNINGGARIDTGSGSVEAHTIRGALNIDTGSGGVEATDVEGETVIIDTGSGGVRLERARARKVEVDTGSGSVRTSNIDADNTRIDTGSGSVTLDLVRLGDGSHLVDTGSGRVTVMLPEDASVRIHAETGSGGIDLDVPAARLRKMSRDEVELEIGEGRADLTIDTGSGGISIRRR